MNHNIIPPFMMSITAVEVEKCTKFLVCNPTIKNHSILLPDLQLNLALHIKCVISYLPTRRIHPSEEGHLDVDCLTPNTPA